MTIIGRITTFAIFFTLLSGHTANASYSFPIPGPKKITVDGKSIATVAVGQKVAVVCEFGFIGDWPITDGGSADQYLKAHNNQVPVEIYAGSKKIYSGTLHGAQPPATTPVSANWTPSAADAGSSVWIKCVTDPQKYVYKSELSNVFAKVSGEKKPVLRVPGPPQTFKPLNNPPLPQAKLSVSSATYTVAPNCSKIKQILTAKIAIRNDGFPLAASKGYLELSELGKANLRSDSIKLPDFAAKQTKVVTVTAGTMASYAGAVSGIHEVRIRLKPVLAGSGTSFPMPQPHVFKVSFPMGFCATDQQRALPRPAAGLSRPGIRR